MSRQEPMLMQSPLSKRVYVVTSYVDEGDGLFTARQKFDVTEQFDALTAMRWGECGRENGWHLRSDGYMTSECSYQRIGAMKGNRALDNHQNLVFVKFMGGEEVDSRVYVPHPGACHIAASATDGLCSDSPRKWYELSCGHSFMLYGLEAPAACAVCGKAVER